MSQTGARRDYERGANRPANTGRGMSGTAGVCAARDLDEAVVAGHFRKVRWQRDKRELAEAERMAAKRVAITLPKLKWMAGPDS